MVFYRGLMVLAGRPISKTIALRKKYTIVDKITINCSVLKNCLLLLSKLTGIGLFED